MKITIEFKGIEEYLEFKEKTAQEGQVQEQLQDNYMTKVDEFNLPLE